MAAQAVRLREHGHVLRLPTTMTFMQEILTSSIPAIGGIGLLVMLAGLIAAGGFVLRRRGVLSRISQMD